MDIERTLSKNLTVLGHMICFQRDIKRERERPTLELMIKKQRERVRARGRGGGETRITLNSFLIKVK